MRAGFFRKCPTTVSAAAAKAAIAGVSRVPDRTSRSCPPPCCTGVSFTARPNHQRADADRAADLVPGDGHGVQPGSLEVHRQEPKAWTASEWTGIAAPGRRSTISATGWTLPTSLLAHITVTKAIEAGSRDSSRRTAGQGDDAVRVHRQPDRLGALVPLEPFDGVQHGMVLDGGAQDARWRRGSRRAGPSTGP